MNWEDECYLLSKNKFRENANIINIFSPKKGKVSGIVYGRNVIQHDNPAGITRALMAVVHNGLSAKEAMDLIN